MNRRGAFQRIVALGLLLSLQASLAPALSGTATAALSGRVLLAGGGTAVTSGKVLVGDPRTGRISTTKLSADGTFALEGLAPATYQVAVETGGVLNVASNPVHLLPGQAKAVQVSVDPLLAAQDPMAPPTAEDKKRNTMTLWSNPLMATAIVVVSAVVVGVAVDGLTDDEEQPASAF